MKKDLRGKLAGKGWAEHEIVRAQQAVETAKEHDVHFSKIVFYTALIVIVFGNLLVSFAVMFLAVFISSLLMYLVAIVLGGMVGFLYNFLITDVGHLEKKHHAFAGIVIPIIAILNLALMVFVANKFIVNLGVNNLQHSPWVLGAVFVVAFLLPTIVDKVFFGKK
ncbi:MAG: hypothetical protein ABIG93_04135 [archaeon]|nr:hypothetical protein [Nanoarchaeota archaeon]